MRASRSAISGKARRIEAGEPPREGTRWPREAPAKGSGVDGLLVAAALMVAEQRRAVLLGDLFEDVRVAAGRTTLGHGTVPGDEVALRVVVAAEEDATAARSALDDAAAAIVARAIESHFLQLDVFALGIVRAGGELAEAAVLHRQRLSALRAFLVEDPVGLLGDGDLPFLVHRDLLRVAAVRVGGAGDERAEAPLAQNHRRPALLAGAVILRDRRGLCGRPRSSRLPPVPVAGDDRGDLLRVLAVRVSGAGHEAAVPAPFDDHRLAALLADPIGRLFHFFDVFHVGRGRLQVLGELFVEPLQGVDVV